MEPFFSIIIPSYNYAKYLPFAIDSILTQDYRNFEIVLIDDGSSDESPAISDTYAKNDNRVRLVKHKENKGLFVRTEEGIHLARGKYIHLFSADDVYLPGCLSKYASLLSQNPQLGLVCGDMCYFKENIDNKDVKYLLKNQSEPCVFSPEKLISVFQKTNFWIPGCSSIAKKELILKYGGHVPKLENISDWYLFHRIALFEGVGYIPESLIAMRVHDQTYTKQVKNDKNRKRATYKALLEELDRNRATKEKFKEAALLAFVFKEFRWKMRFNPKYWSFWPYIYQKNKNSSL